MTQLNCLFYSNACAHTFISKSWSSHSLSFALLDPRSSLSNCHYRIGFVHLKLLTFSLEKADCLLLEFRKLQRDCLTELGCQPLHFHDSARTHLFLNSNYYFDYEKIFQIFFKVAICGKL